MALSTDAQHDTILRGYIETVFRKAGDVAKFDTIALKAAVAAADQWVDDNAASFNTALPVGFRTNATASQKAILLAYVALERAGVL